MTYQIASDVRLVSLAVNVTVGIPDTDHVRKSRDSVSRTSTLRLKMSWSGITRSILALHAYEGPFNLACQDSLCYES